MKTLKFGTFYENTILENIDLEAYNIDTEQMTNFDKVAEVYTIFTKEYLHHNNKNQDQTKLFKEWLQGLPSVLTVPFYNYEILTNAKNNGFDLSDEEKEDTFLENYFLNLSTAFFTLYNNL